MIAKLQHPILRRLYVIGWIALVTVTLLQSSQQPLVGPAAPLSFDLGWELLLTLAHAAAFGIMIALLWWALHPARRALPVALVFCCVYGGVTELLQTAVPDRGASLGDFAVDCLVSGIVALAIYYRASLPTHKFVPSLLK